MENDEKHLIRCTYAIYKESDKKRQSDLKNQLEENIKNYPFHKNVNATKVFLRIINNVKN